MLNPQLVETLFAELLREAKGELSVNERREIQSFLDVGEYGLALEVAADIYTEESKVPSAPVLALMKKLTLAMDLEPITVLAQFGCPDSSNCVGDES